MYKWAGCSLEHPAAQVEIISSKVLKRGKIYYYGISWFNIAPERVVVNARYKPAWIEMKVKRI